MTPTPSRKDILMFRYTTPTGPKQFFWADFGYADVHRRIYERTGVQTSLLHTGGGCIVLEARLDDNTWLWISEYADTLTPMEVREAREAAGTPVGWALHIHPSDTESAARPQPQAAPDTMVILASLTHPAATADRLPELVAHLLRHAPNDAHIAYSADDSGYHVTYGHRAS